MTSALQKGNMFQIEHYFIVFHNIFNDSQKEGGELIFLYFFRK